MSIKDFYRAHLIGIGGINVSAIAKLFLAQGKITSGSDLVGSEITAELAEKGVRVVIGHAKENVAPDVDMVIYSDAVPADNPERIAASERNIPQMSNFQFWGKYAADKKVIAVSGTNGKSTTTAMLGLILEAAGLDPTVVVGTRVLQWGTNIRIGKPPHPYGYGGKSEWLVIEADEYRAHMLEFKPHVAVITNITPDHLDFYKDLDDIVAYFQKWIETIPPAGGLILNPNDAASQKLRINNIKTKNFTSVIPTRSHVVSTPPRILRGGGRDPLYMGQPDGRPSISGSDPDPMYIGSGSEQQKGKPRVEESLHLQVPGAFNIANALAAAAAAQLLAVSNDIIVSALNNFTGTWRRFEKVGEYKGALVISDYAHHPDGIKVTLQAAREKYPNRRLVLLYQPHQHNRTKKLFNDFVASFDLADELILAEIYDVPGREQNEDQAVSSKDLVEQIKKRLVNQTHRAPHPAFADATAGLRPSPLPKGDGGSRVSYAPDLQSAEEMIKNIIQANDVLIVMGAGDVDKVARNLIKL